MKPGNCEMAPSAALVACVGGFLVSAVGLAQDPTRFETDIQAFERTDKANPPPPEPVLFVGSSSIRAWSGLNAAFPDYALLNRGFGGSHMSDLLHYFDRVVAVYAPSVAVVYEGDNDLAGGKPVSQVLADYQEFLDRVRQAIPGTGVFLLAVKPSPSRAADLDAQRALNTRLATLAAADPGVEFIDVFTPMLGDDGQPRRELFQSDMLHLNATGYALWISSVGPVLDAWLGSGGTPPSGETIDPILNPANNLSDTARVIGMRPTSNGEITIALSPSTDNDNGNHFTYLGVMRVTPKLSDSRMDTPLLENGKLRLNWDGPGRLQSAPSVTEPWSTVEPAPSAPHLEPLDSVPERFSRLSSTSD